MMSCGLGLGALYFEMSLVKSCYLPGGTSSTLLLSQLKHWQALMLCNLLSLVMEGHYKLRMTALLSSLK